MSDSGLKLDISCENCGEEDIEVDQDGWPEVLFYSGRSDYRADEMRLLLERLAGEGNSDDDVRIFRILLESAAEGFVENEWHASALYHFSLLSETYNVLTDIGGVAGGVTAITATGRAALRFVRNRVLGRRPAIPEVLAASVEAVEHIYSETLSSDPDELVWDKQTFKATWLTKDWEYEVVLSDVLRGTPVVTRKARQAPTSP